MSSKYVVLAVGSFAKPLVKLIRLCSPKATITEVAEAPSAPLCSVITSDNTHFYGMSAVLGALASEQKGDTTMGHLLGATEYQRALIHQFCTLSLQVNNGSASMGEAELLLSHVGVPKTVKYLAGGDHASAADLFMHAAVASAAATDPTSFPTLDTWATSVEKDMLLSEFTVDRKQLLAAAAGGAAADGHGKKKKEGAGGAGGPPAHKPTEEEIAAKRAEKERLKAEKAAAAADAAAAGAAPGGKKQSPPSPAKGKVSSEGLEIRVGVIKNVARHPTADKLFVESIDIGEATGPRTIVSGLVGHCAAEELQDKSVLVLCNLKAKALQGTQSHGMVLVAEVKSADGVCTLEVLSPPEGAAPGTCVVFGSNQPLAHSLTPISSSKFTDFLGPLNTDGNGQVCWGDEPATVSGGKLVSKLTKATVR